MALVTLLLATNEKQSFAHGTGGARPGVFGGALRGSYLIHGKVLCTNCSVQEMQKASPTHLHNLYVLKNKQQQAVLQIIQLRNTASGRESLLGRWEAITGLTRQLAIRAEESLWQQLIATENQQKEILLTGLLQSTGTFDVSVLIVLEETTGVKER